MWSPRIRQCSGRLALWCSAYRWTAFLPPPPTAVSPAPAGPHQRCGLRQRSRPGHMASSLAWSLHGGAPHGWNHGRRCGWGSGRSLPGPSLGLDHHRDHLSCRSPASGGPGGCSGCPCDPLQRPGPRPCCRPDFHLPVLVSAALLHTMAREQNQPVPPVGGEPGQQRLCRHHPGGWRKSSIGRLDGVSQQAGPGAGASWLPGQPGSPGGPGAGGALGATLCRTAGDPGPAPAGCWHLTDLGRGWPAPVASTDPAPI